MQKRLVILCKEGGINALHSVHIIHGRRLSETFHLPSIASACHLRERPWSVNEIPSEMQFNPTVGGNATAESTDISRSKNELSTSHVFEDGTGCKTSIRASWRGKKSGFCSRMCLRCVEPRSFGAPYSAYWTLMLRKCETWVLLATDMETLRVSQGIRGLYGHHERNAKLYFGRGNLLYDHHYHSADKDNVNNI